MGSLGGALGQVGEAAAATPVGQFITSAGTEGFAPAVSQFATNLGEQSGLANLGAGLQSLFGGGEPTAAAQPGFVGPPSPYAAPSFGESLVRGLTGQNIGGGADVPTPGGQVGGGVGELIAMLEKIRQQSGGQMAPMVPTGGGGGPAVRLMPGYHQAQAPTGGLIHNLIGAFTYGILGGAIPSSGQV